MSRVQGPALGTNRWEEFTFVPVAGQVTIQGSDVNGTILGYKVGFVMMYVNGVRLSAKRDYTATDGTSIALIGGLSFSGGEEVVIVGMPPLNFADVYGKNAADARFARKDITSPFLWTLTGSGNWQAPSWVTINSVFKITVTGSGAGGSGGYQNNVTGCGGGAGGTAIKSMSGFVAGQNYAYIAGTGGAAAAAASSGLTGQNSTFTGPSSTILTGLTGGAASSPYAGTGGGSSGGDLNIIGGMGTSSATSSVTGWNVAGSGGASYWGGGGRGGTNYDGVAAEPGQNGLAYGSGGGGGSATTNRQGAGGAGANGVIVIEVVTP